MRVALGSLLVLVAASSAAAQPPPPPAACRYVVDIKNKMVAATTQPTAECEYKGAILMMVNNLDTVKYQVEIRNFKFNPASVSTCTGAATLVTQMPINGSETGGKFRFSVNAETTKTKKKNIKAMGAHAKECFKFDIALFENGAATPVNTLDPELVVGEPQPPPPPPPAGPPKKPGGN